MAYFSQVDESQISGPEKPLCVLRHPGQRTLLDRSGDGRYEAAEESEYAMTKMKILSHRALRGLSDGRGGGARSASDAIDCMHVGRTLERTRWCRRRNVEDDAGHGNRGGNRGIGPMWRMRLLAGLD